MLHPLAIPIRRKESANSMPVWSGVGLYFAGLVTSGWMAVATLSLHAWFVGIIASLIFVIALLAFITYLFPEERGKRY